MSHHHQHPWCPSTWTCKAAARCTEGMLCSHEALHPEVADGEGEIIVESFNTNRTNNDLSHVTAKSVIARKNIRSLHRLPITGPGTKVG